MLQTSYTQIGKVCELQGADPASAAAAGTGAAAAREGGEGARGGGSGHGGQDLGRVGGQVAVQSAARGEHLDRGVRRESGKIILSVLFGHPVFGTPLATTP